MRCKKVLSVGFALVLLLTMLSAAALPVSAATAATVTVVNTTGIQGSSVAVYVKVAGVIASAEGTITYDSSKLTLSSISKADGINGLLETGTGVNKSLFSFANPRNNNLNNDNFLKLTFKVKSGASGSASVSIRDLKLFQIGKGTVYSISHTLKPGSVAIKSAATKITPAKKTMDLTQGKSATLGYSLSPSTAGDKAAGKVTFSSNNTGVATVNAKTGQIKAKSSGTATITIKGVNASATCKVTVYNYVSLRVGRTKAIANGTVTTVDQDGAKPFILGKRTMIPLRFVGEKMKGKVKYYSDSQPIILTYGSKRVEFRLNSKTITIYSGNKRTTQTIDVVAQKRNGRTYIPLRAIAQALGFAVYYQSGTEIIVVNTPAMSPTLRSTRLAEAKSYLR